MPAASVFTGRIYRQEAGRRRPLAAVVLITTAETSGGGYSADAGDVHGDLSAVPHLLPLGHALWAVLCPGCAHGVTGW